MKQRIDEEKRQQAELHSLMREINKQASYIQSNATLHDLPICHNSQGEIDLEQMDLLNSARDLEKLPNSADSDDDEVFPIQASPTRIGTGHMAARPRPKRGV